MTTKTNIKGLFGLPPTSRKVEEYVASLSSLANTGSSGKTQIKAYPDAVFVNYHNFGCSIEYRPTNSYKPSSNIQSITDLQTNNLALDKIDIYNSPHEDESASPSPPTSKKTRSKTTPTFAKYPSLPLTITFSHEPKSMSVSTNSTGKDFIAALGEPDRKGGGSGPSSGSINIWCCCLLLPPSVKKGEIGRFLLAMRARLVFDTGALEARRLGRYMFSGVVMFGSSRVMLTPKREVYVPVPPDDRVQSEGAVRYDR